MIIKKNSLKKKSLKMNKFENNQYKTEFVVLDNINITILESLESLES